MTIRPMRCAASVGLFALGLPALLGGCNQIFGISQTVAYDAPVDVIARHDYARLVWQVAAVTPDGKPDAPQLVPISPMPAIRLAKLGAAGDPLGAWMAPSDEQTSTYATDGAVNVPADFFGAPWRMEYTLADGVPHEVQWNAPDGAGLVTVPVFGRLMRDALPAGSGYTVTPTGTPGEGQQPPPPPVANTRLFTTGLWAESKVQSPTSVNVDSMAMVSLSGTFGKVDAAKGDRALMLAFASDAKCTYAFSGAELTDATLTSDAHTTATPPWLNTTAPPNAPTAGMPESTRLGAIGDLGDGNVDGSTSIVTFGVAPSSLMPGLAATAAPADAFRPMPLPVMITTVTCPYNTVMPSTVGTSVLPEFPRAIHLQLVNSRTFMGAILSSGIESTMLAADTGTFKLALPAPFATKIRLTPQGATDETSLDGDASELVPFAASDKPLLLTFQPETGPKLRADVYEVRLHTITAGGALTTERIYTIPAGTNPSVKIDGALLAKGKTYIFEIRTIKGHPAAPTFDFSVVDYPYGQTIVFPRSFVVQ